ncbi:MAG: tetratricopeptide repeat protein [Pirellulaceae bacterium]
MSHLSRKVSNPWILRTIHGALAASLLIVIGMRVYQYFSTPPRDDSRSSASVLRSSVTRQWLSVADDAFAHERWDLAAQAFENVLTREPENLSAWVRLAYARHMQGHYDPALAAYLRVCQFDGRPRQWALYNIAAVYALKNEKRMALDYLQEAIEAGFRQQDTDPPIVEDSDFQSIAGDPEFLRLAELTKPVSKRDVYRQLDLMIGKWRLTNSQQNRIGVVEFKVTSGGYALIGECVDDTRHSNSTWLLFYEPRISKWRLVWLDDQGHIGQLAGSTAEDESMVLDGEQVTPDGRVRTAQTILKELDNGCLHISFKVSPDGGNHWTDVLVAQLLPFETKSSGPAEKPAGVPE